ncbi:MAG: T9SS type A sorting domain-containing protein [Bacteroidia bacterium]
MIKTLPLICALTFVFQTTVSQNPLVKNWDYRYGGMHDDDLSVLVQTADGGYLLGGRSLSDIGGDKTQPSWGDFDYWVVKTDAMGILQWEKRFGGFNDDYLHSVQQTSDGGYILGGFSVSGISGDKTEPSWNSFDFWIVKIDALGIKQWDKRYGGTEYDPLFSIKQTTDGGYILGGYSYSNISGDKTQPNWDSTLLSPDYWIVKINSSGNKEWDKTFGGDEWDALYAVEQTTDGGYILGGYSLSGISGDKSEPSWGGYDHWLVKTDAMGNKQWDRRYGGIHNDYLNSLHQTFDGGFVFGGKSLSDSSGDKTEHSWGGYDYWIVRTDAAGNKLWNKRYGGTDNEDDFGNLDLDYDGGVIIAGTSYSNIGGDKTEDNLGSEQMWVVKTDSLGVKKWDKTIFTMGHDETGFAIKALDGCYLAANYTNAGIGGYKTQLPWNNTLDYWVVKFCDSTFVGINKFNEEDKQVTIFPNPATDFITLSFTIPAQKAFSIQLFNLYGQIVKTQHFAFLPPGKQQIQINLKDLQQGIYFVKINSDREDETKKIVKL